jgi:hypothetical protein
MWLWLLGMAAGFVALVGLAYWFCREMDKDLEGY